jgi:hypothetical protein
VDLLNRVLWNSRLRIVEIYFAEYLSISDKNIDSIVKIAFMFLGKGGRLLDQFLAELARRMKVEIICTKLDANRERYMEYAEL